MIDPAVLFTRAGDRTRTGDVQLGKLAFYQLNYAREPNKLAPRQCRNKLGVNSSQLRATSRQHSASSESYLIPAASGTVQTGDIGKP